MDSRRLSMAAVVFAGSMALLPYSFHAERHLETATLVEGSQAHAVKQQLSTRFHSPFVDQVVLVVQGLPPVDSDTGTQALTKIVGTVKEQPGVTGVLSYLDAQDVIFQGRGGGTFVLIGLSSSNSPVESLVPGLHSAAAQLQSSLRTQYPSATLELTGEIPLNADIRKASAADVRRGEFLVIPATLVLLFIAFGSCAAAVIPLVVGELAIAMTMALAGMLGQHWHLSILVQNLATMLGLGLGIDYALLMISRFREALAAGEERTAAAALAARNAGRTLLVSASTVAIGFLALLLVPISEIRSIGVAGFLVAAMCVLLTNVLVPALLGTMGRRIDFGKLPFTPQLDCQHAVRKGRRWRAWGRSVAAHPWLALLLASSPMLLLAWQAASLDMSLPRGNWLPPRAESVHALHTLEQMDRGGVVESVRMIVDLPQGSIATSDGDWAAIDLATRTLAGDPRAAKVVSITSIADGGRASLLNVPRATRRAFLSSDGKAALIEVVPKSAVSLRGQVDWVRDLRSTPAQSLTGLPGASVLVGGIPALNADYETIVERYLPLVLLLVVGGTLLALLLGFRSLIAATKAILLNLFSVAASFGVLVLVFQRGHGSGLMGVPGGTGSVFPLVPIVAFAIVFGLSMDYEVFLVARVLEARRSGMNEQEAIAEGLARTAGLITSAAAIMIVVFAAFTFGEFLVVKMIGFTLAVAVLIDATLVRMVIGPALLSIAGDWNWWPGGLKKH